MEREELILALREVTDLERIIGRVVYGSANARDLASLATGLGKIPKLRELCGIERAQTQAAAVSVTKL